MKLFLKIMTAMFIFAVIGITSCSKNQLGLDVGESAYSETVEGTDVQHEDKAKQITAILESKEGIKIINNYTDSETGMTGTLYEYVDYKGITQRIVKLDKKPENLDKAWWPRMHTVVAVPRPGGGYDIECTGAADDCFGWADTTWWLPW